MKFNRLAYLFITCVPALLYAGNVYRIVDATGHVTFSDAPPSPDVNAEQVEVNAGPSEERVREAEARVQAMQQQLQKLQSERLQKSTERGDRVTEAQDNLKKAEEDLAATKEIRDEDRQNLVGGTRRIRPEYFDRIKEAEARVDDAAKELNKARRD